MRTAFRRSRPLRSLLFAAALSFFACAKTDYAKLYSTKIKAPSFRDDEIESLKRLGPTQVDHGVNFGVYAEHATKVQIMLFDNGDSDEPSRVFDLTRYGNVWNIYVEGVGLGQAYGYRAWGPNWPYDPAWTPGSIKGFVADADLDGNRYNPNKLLIDPYSKGITRDHDWSRGSTASGPQRTSLDYGAAMKSVVVQSSFKWSAQEAAYRKARQNSAAPGHGWNDLIIYETHPKGFTMSSASGSQHPGTYLGIAEKADYLAQLGITAVQLMPVFEKPLDGGYWGYQTLNFFTPENTYAFAVRPEQRIDEFKFMVDELHKRNIEVILDVVYNHTGEGGLWRQKVQFGGAGLDTSLDPRNFQNYDPRDTAGLYAYRGLDNIAYYALSGADRGYYNDGLTGVGNATRLNTTVWRQLILDSLRYWVTEMHVDGFRFDLAAAMGASEPNIDCHQLRQGGYDDAFVRTTTLQYVVDDPTLQSFNTRVIAEPWGAGDCFAMGSFPASTTKPGDAWYEHNGWFRDFWRDLVNGTSISYCAKDDGHGNCLTTAYDRWRLNSTEGGSNNFGDTVFGTKSLFSDPASKHISKQRHPYNSVNFITVHDGFTLYDLFSFNEKQNGCGPLSPDCCQPVTAYCNNDGEDHNRSHDWSAPTWDQDVTCGADPSCESNKCSTWNYASSATWSGYKGPAAPIPPPTLQSCMDNYCGADPKCLSPTSGQNHGYAEPVKRQLMRAMFSAMMLSRGTPMLLGGDEWMRTQRGNNNAYTTLADNSANWYDWANWSNSAPANRMHDFVSQLIAFRKAHADALAPTDYDGAPSITWASPQGGAPNWDGHAVQVIYGTTQSAPFVMLVNMDPTPAAFSLPSGKAWKLVMDTSGAYEQLGNLGHATLDTTQTLPLTWPSTPDIPPGNPDAKRTGNISVAAPIPWNASSYTVDGRSIAVLVAG